MRGIEDRLYVAHQPLAAFIQLGERLGRRTQAISYYHIATTLFGAAHAYAQPHSGIDANLVAFWSVSSAPCLRRSRASSCRPGGTC